MALEDSINIPPVYSIDDLPGAVQAAEPPLMDSVLHAATAAVTLRAVDRSKLSRRSFLPVIVHASLISGASVLTALYFLHRIVAGGKASSFAGMLLGYTLVLVLNIAASSALLAWLNRYLYGLPSPMATEWHVAVASLTLGPVAVLVQFINLWLGLVAVAGVCAASIIFYNRCYDGVKAEKEENRMAYKVVAGLLLAMSVQSLAYSWTRVLFL